MKVFYIFFNIYINDYEDYNNKFKILIKLIFATKYTIKFKNWNINCIKNI